MNVNKLGMVAAGLLSLVTCLAVTAPVHAKKAHPIHDDAFYVPPADLSDYERGDIIRWENEPDMDADLFTQYAEAYRVMYVTKGAHHHKVAATAMIFIPFVDGKGEPVEGPLDAVAWAHGTVGVGDFCASSKWPQLYPQYTWGGYAKPVRKILKKGMVAVAVDYEALGTPGIHPWLHGKSAGNAIIDAVRASRNLAALPDIDVETTNRWGVWGHSQGALASRAANVLANWVAPELVFVGSVEVAAISNANIWASVVENFAVAEGAFPYLGYAAHAVRALDGNFVPENLLGPLLLEEVEVEPGVFTPKFELAAELCWDDWFEAFTGPQPQPAEVLNSDFASDASVSIWLRGAAFGGFGYHASGPAFLIFGELDELSPPAIRDAYLDDLDQVGRLDYETLVVEGAGHDAALKRTKRQAIKWLIERFEALD